MVVGGQRIINRLNLPVSLSICGFDVPLSQAVRDLGLLMDTSLSLDQHIARTSPVAFFYLKLVSRLRQSLPPSVRLSAIHSLTLSRINFCTSLLFGVKKSALHNLQRIINSSMRAAMGMRKFDSISSELKKNGWLSTEHLVTYRLLCLVHRVLTQGVLHIYSIS